LLYMLHFLVLSKVMNCSSICFFFRNALFIYVLWNAQFFIVFLPE
jgi:hypothetical protein